MTTTTVDHVHGKLATHVKLAIPRVAALKANGRWPAWRDASLAEMKDRLATFAATSEYELVGEWDVYDLEEPAIDEYRLEVVRGFLRKDPRGRKDPST